MPCFSFSTRICCICSYLTPGAYTDVIFEEFMSSTLMLLSAHRTLRAISRLQGFLIVLVALTALFGCVWLREQLVIGGEPDWLADGEGAAEEDREGEEVEVEGVGEAAAPVEVVPVPGPVAAAAAPVNNTDDQANPG